MSAGPKAYFIFYSGAEFVSSHSHLSSPSSLFTMNSSEPGSPTSSDSGSLPDEVQLQPSQSSSSAGGFMSSVLSGLTGSSKRRAAPAPGGGNRDAKSRRREDPRALRGMSSQSGSMHWEKEGLGLKRDKDELVDNALVDSLRKGKSYFALSHPCSSTSCRNWGPIPRRTLQLFLASFFAVELALYVRLRSFVAAPTNIYISGILSLSSTVEPTNPGLFSTPQIQPYSCTTVRQEKILIV